MRLACWQARPRDCELFSKPSCFWLSAFTEKIVSARRRNQHAGRVRYLRIGFSSAHRRVFIAPDEKSKNEIAHQNKEPRGCEKCRDERALPKSRSSQ